MKTAKQLTDAQIGAAFRPLISGTGSLDFNLLQTQKVSLVEAIDAAEGDTADLEGILNFLDAFQDVCADKLKIWKFPETSDG